MSVPTIVIPTPATFVPSSSTGVVAGARRFGRAVWNALLGAGERRALRELRLMVATHGERFPELAERVRTLDAEAAARKSA